jgi:hypothetical protein
MRLPLVTWLCLAVPLLPASAQPATPSPAATVAAMPRELRFWQRDGGVTDYEARPGGAGLGASVRYRGTRGLNGVATVYVYDRGVARQPAGATGNGVVAELDTAISEVREIAATGRYRLLSDPVRMTAGAAAGPGTARCALFPLQLPDGETTREAICVAAHDRRFLKTRVTLRDDPDARRAGIIAFVLMSETVPGFYRADASSTGR